MQSPSTRVACRIGNLAHGRLTSDSGHAPDLAFARKRTWQGPSFLDACFQVSQVSERYWFPTGYCHEPVKSDMVIQYQRGVKVRDYVTLRGITKRCGNEVKAV